MLAAHPEFGILGVQATTTSNAAARQTKALAEPRLVTWLRAGAQFEVWGWAKRGPAGKRKLRTLSRRRIMRLNGAFQVEVIGGVVRQGNESAIG